MRQYLKLFENDTQDYAGPISSPDITYKADETGGKITKITAFLTSQLSGKYTKLGRNLLKIKKAKEDLKMLEDETKDMTKELVGDLFHAEDEVYSRFVDTVSFIFEMSKKPKATETFKYAKIFEELEKDMTPELLARYHDLKEKYKTVTQKSPSLTAIDKNAPVATEESIVNEGMADKLKAFFSKFYQAIKGWGVSYDSKLDALKAEVGF